MGIRLRVAGPADEVSIGVLMGELMPHADTARRQRWLYRENPDGPAVTVLATDEESGELAGMTSAFPRRMSAGGRIVLGALGGDGWVRPRFRRRGIGSLMHLASHAAQAARGIEMMFGTPSPANATALRFAGARDVTSVRRWIRPILGVNGLLRDLCGRASRTRVEVAAPGDAGLDVAWADFTRGARVATVRDSEFLRWRFQSAPSRAHSLRLVRDANGGVLGSCALEVSETRVRVIDIVAAIDRIPRVLRAIAGSLDGADVLELRLDESTGRGLRLWRHGFVPRERLPLNVMMTSAAGWQDASFSDGRNWFATWADTDLDATWRHAFSPETSVTHTNEFLHPVSIASRGT